MTKEWPYKGNLRLSEIDNIRDCPEEMQDDEMFKYTDRYEFVAFLQKIIDSHTYEEREADVVARIPLESPRKPADALFHTARYPTSQNQ